MPVQKTAPSHGLRVGTNVFQSKFFDAKGLAIEGTGDAVRALGRSSRHAAWRLAGSVAKLTLMHGVGVNKILTLRKGPQ